MSNIGGKELSLTAKLLDLASNQFSRHGCNDLSESVYEGWSIEDKKKFVREYHEWNGDPEEFDEDFLYLPDYAIMRFLAHKIKAKG